MKIKILLSIYQMAFRKRRISERERKVTSVNISPKFGTKLCNFLAI